MKLYHKLNAALLFIALLSATVLSAVFFKFQRDAILKSEAEKIVLMQQAVRSMIREANLANDSLMIADYLDNLRRTHPEIISVKLNSNGIWNEIKFKHKKTGKSDERENSFEKEISEGATRVKIKFAKDFFKTERNKIFIAITKKLINSTIIALLISALVAFLLSYTMTKRLRLIAKYADKIGKNKLGEQIKIKGSDEISDLALAFNLMSKKLSEIEDMKRTFMSSVTHELRSPLGAIKSYIDITLKNRKDWTISEKGNFERIKKNASRLSDFVTTLLDIAKIEKGKMEIRAISSDIKPIIEETALFFKPQIQSAGLSLKSNLNDPLPKVEIDSELIIHVLSNFISNALKFTAKGGEIIITAAPSGLNRLRIKVSDTGIGLNKKRSSELFSPFEQIPNSKNRKGTGLGLYLSKKIIELHKGDIGFTSEKGKGSVFWFEIPLSKKP